MNAVHYAHRESARMIVSLREWSWICEKKKSLLWRRWLYFTFIWRIVSLREWSWVSDNDSQSLIFLFWKSVNQWVCFSDSQLSIFLFVEISRHSVNSRSSCLSIFDIHLMISTILIFLSVETSLVKERNRSHTHIKSFISNKQINTQNIKQKKIWISFHFVCFSVSVYFNDTQWVRYND